MAQLKTIAAVLIVVTLLCACRSRLQQRTELSTNNVANAEPQVQSPLPPPTGFVNDYASVFDSARKQELEKLLKALRDNSSIEFAVVTIKTTNGQPIFDYSLAVAKSWGIGPKDKSVGGGLLLLLAIEDRQWRLQVSRSLEKDLPDDVCKELGDQSVDLYKQGRYDQGIVKYVNSIIQRLQKIRGFSIKPAEVDVR